MSGDELCRYIADRRSLMTALHREIMHVQRAEMTMLPIGTAMHSYELSALEMVWPAMADLTDAGNLMKQNQYLAALDRLIRAQESLGHVYALLSEGGAAAQVIIE